LEGRGLIGLQQVPSRDLWRLKIGALQPRQVILEVAPGARDRVQLRTVGREPRRADMFRPPPVLSGVCAAVLQAQDRQAIRQRLGQGLEEAWAQVGMHVRQCQKAALAGRGRHRTIDRELLEAGLDRSDGWDAAGGEAAAHGQQAQTTVVLAARAHQGGRRWRDDAPKRLQTACLKCADVPRANSH
jgi:hypothetical protein